jgi:hypothetical protein
MLPLLLLIVSIIGLVAQGVTWYWITLLIISIIWLLVKIGGGGGGVTDAFSGFDFFD